MVMYNPPGAEWDGPKQGGAHSCVLIAALSSIAWICWPVFPYPNATTKSSCLTPTNELAPKLYKQDATTGQPAGTMRCCAVDPSFGPCSSVDTHGGIWVPVYEKAYVKQFSNCVAGSDSDPNICKFGSFPQKTGGLVSLTGWPHTDFFSPFGTEPYTNIYNLSPPESRPRPKFPMVAWTRTANDPIWANNPNGYDQIIPDHCYSILGTLAPSYIVLRNPRAIKEVVNSGSGHLLPDGTLFFAPSGGTMYAFNNGSKDYTQKRNIPAINLNINKGLFAIENEQFKNYFTGYGYVKGNY
jgi:hypothetical protein